VSAYRERISRPPGDDNYHVVRVEFVGPLGEAALSEARIIVAGALRPCPARTLKIELLRLKVATRFENKVNEDEVALTFAVYSEALSQYPEDIVVSVLRDWPKSGKIFWPQLGDLHPPCDRLVEERRRLQRALELAAQPPKASPMKVDEREPWTAERHRDHEAKMAEVWRRLGGPPRERERLPQHCELDELPPLRPIGELFARDGWRGLIGADDPRVGARVREIGDDEAPARLERQR
jgi:hypothetical protein